MLKLMNMSWFTLGKRYYFLPLFLNFFFLIFQINPGSYYGTPEEFDQMQANRRTRTLRLYLKGQLPIVQKWLKVRLRPNAVHIGVHIGVEIDE